VAGARVNLSMSPRDVTLTLTALASRGSTADLLERFRSHASRLAAARLPDREAGRARWAAARSTYQDLADPDRAPVFLGLLASPGDGEADTAGDVAGLDAARIQTAARALALDRMVVVAAGDPDALVPQLRAAGFEVEVEVMPEAAPR